MEESPSVGSSYRRSVTHVGVSVDDLERAIDWYENVLGFDLIMQPLRIDATDSYVGRAATDVFGPAFKALRQAHLSAGNGVALEIFEFIDPAPERRQDAFEYWKNGFFHICVTDRDIEGLAAKIAQHGGRIRTSRTWRVFPGQPYRFCYCEDPFGNIIELYTHSHEQTFSNQPGY